MICPRCMKIIATLPIKSKDGTLICAVCRYKEEFGGDRT